MPSRDLQQWRLSARCRDAARGACTEHVLTGAASRAIDVSWSAYHVFSARDARHQHPRPLCTPSMMPLGTDRRVVRWQSTMLEQPDFRAPSVVGVGNHRISKGSTPFYSARAPTTSAERIPRGPFGHRGARRAREALSAASEEPGDRRQASTSAAQL